MIQQAKNPSFWWRIEISPKVGKKKMEHGWRKEKESLRQIFLSPQSDNLLTIPLVLLAKQPLDQIVQSSKTKPLPLDQNHHHPSQDIFQNLLEQILVFSSRASRRTKLVKTENLQKERLSFFHSQTYRRNFFRNCNFFHTLENYSQNIS